MLVRAYAEFGSAFRPVFALKLALLVSITQLVFGILFSIDTVVVGFLF